MTNWQIYCALTVLFFIQLELTWIRKALEERNERDKAPSETSPLEPTREELERLGL